MVRIAAAFVIASLSGLAAAAPARAAGDPVVGGKLFLQCRACHTIAPGAPGGVGPNLHGVVGAQAASRGTYAYSPALAKSGIVWTEASLDAFLTKPNALVPGTKMAFAGVGSPKARADLIAYLATLKDDARR